MTSLIRMRIFAFVRSGRIVAPMVTALVAILAQSGGGKAPAGEAYGLSAYILLPMLAWQTKALLDTEPDVARRLVIVTVGRRRELVAGLIAATVMALVTIVLALVMPWLIGGIKVRTHPSVATGITLGIWAHLAVVPPALALGALASRVVTQSAGFGALALVGGWLLVVIAGLPRSPVRWIVPPLINIAKAARTHIEAGRVIGLTAWSVAWALIAVSAYVTLRRSRA